MITLAPEIQKDIEKATAILKDAGCREIYVFGSLVEGNFTEESDIDFAVTGLPKENFFSAYGQLLEQLSRNVDLIGLDYDNDFSKRIKLTRKLERVA
jgi:predicted nucleotidyltransferase